MRRRSVKREIGNWNLGSVLTLVLATSWSVFAADNLLTPQEKAQGWILLFDGKSLNGWDAGRGGIATKQGTGPAVGSNPRACSTPLGWGVYLPALHAGRW